MHIVGCLPAHHDGEEADDEVADHVEDDSRLVLSLETREIHHRLEEGQESLPVVSSEVHRLCS